MKKLFSAFLLTGLLLGTGCAHNSKCAGQCDVKKSADKKSCCCSKDKAQCDVKKKS